MIHPVAGEDGVSGRQILMLLGSGLSLVGAITLYYGWIELGNNEHNGLAKTLTAAGMGLLASSIPLWIAVAD